MIDGRSELIHVSADELDQLMDVSMKLANQSANDGDFSQACFWMHQANRALLWKVYDRVRGE